MKWLRSFSIPIFLVGWLAVISPDSLVTCSSLFSSVVGGSAQAPAPADNDDASADGVAADDCTLVNCRIESRVPAVIALRASLAAFDPPVSRKVPAFILPGVWQFVERAAAPPRAPSAIV